MSEIAVKKHQLIQLEAVLESPILMLEPGDQELVILQAKRLLNSSGRCCVITATSTSDQTLKNIIAQYRALATLKKLKRQLCSESSLEGISFIGIYPSLEYPACVYELETSANRYVSANVLPYTRSIFLGVIRKLLSRILGFDPYIGASGLILYRD